MELNIDTRDFMRVLLPLASMPKAVDKAIRAALKRTGTSMAVGIARQIRQRSFLKTGEILPALSKPLLTGSSGNMRIEVRVAGKPLAMDHFRLVPRRITARKGQRSLHWPEAGYQIGPGEPVRHLPGKQGRSRAFAIRLGGRLFLMRRQGKALQRVFGYSVQYFAAFDDTVTSVQEAARTLFAQRLAHEVHYRLGKLR